MRGTIVRLLAGSRGGTEVKLKLLNNGANQIMHK
jgi:hypothetical protein